MRRAHHALARRHALPAAHAPLLQHAERARPPPPHPPRPTHPVTPPHAPPVYADGSICLDILQNQWSPIYDISAILTSIQSLLCDPNPNSPANSEAARLYQAPPALSPRPLVRAGAASLSCGGGGRRKPGPSEGGGGEVCGSVWLSAPRAPFAGEPARVRAQGEGDRRAVVGGR